MVIFDAGKKGRARLEVVSGYYLGGVHAGAIDIQTT